MMPTKEQERQALEKIKKILASLGNNPETSYVCRAFDGCVEHAEDNIENDFANSWKAFAEDYKANYHKLEEELSTKAEANRTLIALVESKNRDVQEEHEDAEEWRKRQIEEEIKRKRAEQELEAAQLEILKLKAKLYDYMVQG